MSDVKPPTLNAASITEAARIVSALPNELPVEVREAAAEGVTEIVRELKAAIPERELAPDHTARDHAIDNAIANAQAALNRTLPPGPVLVAACAKVAELGQALKAPAAGPERPNRRSR